ncbi:transmembrane protein 6/97 [Dichomitus squalens]|uniref:Efficient mitochondria targeting-associated protein 19 n=1 Tax=Dichomitus squalens TaxID=114155 RepID=A0A4Q9MUY6_9APHY|nr:transmembrane protein 6/97 [Dichomitus squalens]
MTRTPLSSRPRDLVYFLFFAIHLPATFLIDIQAIYPKAWVPALISSLPKFYVEMSNDPLIGSAMGYFGESQLKAFTWFRSFLLLEAFFQVPVFLIGLRGLWRGSTSIYVLLLIYAASTATTTIPCLAVILSTPVSPTPLSGISITAEQRLLLLSSYIPFCLVPLVMTFDMAFRVQKLAGSGSGAQKEKRE